MAGRKRTFPISGPILREIAEDCQQRNPVLQIILTCVALIRAQAALDSVKLEGDAKIGVEIIRRACEAPLRQLTENAGVDGSIVVRDVRDGSGAYGYNVATGEYVDMFKAGVIDPTKVTRGALENAASIAGLLLVTEAMVADIPKKDPPPPPAPGGMDGMY